MGNLQFLFRLKSLHDDTVIVAISSTITIKYFQFFLLYYDVVYFAVQCPIRNQQQKIEEKKKLDGYHFFFIRSFWLNIHLVDPF